MPQPRQGTLRYDRLVMLTVCWLFGLLLLGGTVAVAAFDRTLDPRALDEAIGIGQSRIEAVRIRYHLPYQIVIERPPIDYIEIVTPFRRVVLAAETRARLGDRAFGQRDALEMLGEEAARVDVLIEMTFHPLNTYIGVPSYEVALLRTGADSPIEPSEIELVPRHGARVRGTPLSYPYPASPAVPDGSEPLAGGRILARFDGRVLDPMGSYEIIVSEGGDELARGRIELGSLR